MINDKTKTNIYKDKLIVKYIDINL